jgi:hypothetical protein
MRIEDFDSVCDVTKPVDIDAVVSKHHDGGNNALWLSHGEEEFPAIGILVKGDLANVHYFPGDGGASFVSVASVLDSNPEKPVFSLCVRPKRFGSGMTR